MEERTVPADAKEYIYIGEVLPPGSNENDRDIPHHVFSAAHTEEMDLGGLSHIWNHNENIPIGKLHSSFMDGKSNTGEKFVLGSIDVRDIAGKFTVQEEILKGKGLGLSLNHGYRLETFPEGGYRETKTPLDVSSVHVPNSGRPNSRIIFGCFDSDLQRNKKRYIYFFPIILRLTRRHSSGYDISKMAEQAAQLNAQSQPSAAATPPAPQTSTGNPPPQQPPQTTPQQPPPPDTGLNDQQATAQSDVFSQESFANLSKDKLEQFALVAVQENEDLKKRLDAQQGLAETLTKEKQANWANDREKLLEMAKNVSQGEELGGELGSAIDAWGSSDGQSLTSMNTRGKVLETMVKCGTAWEGAIIQKNMEIEQLKHDAVRNKSETSEDVLYRRMQERLGAQTLSTPGRFGTDTASSAERSPQQPQQQFQTPQQQQPQQQFQQQPPPQQQLGTPASMQPPPQKRARQDEGQSDAQEHVDFAYWKTMMSHMQSAPPPSYQ